MSRHVNDKNTHVEDFVCGLCSELSPVRVTMM